MKISTKEAWKIMTHCKMSILMNGEISYSKAKQVLGLIDKEIMDGVKIANIKYYDSKIITWEKGQELDRNAISSAYLKDDILFVLAGNWTMVFKITI